MEAMYYHRDTCRLCGANELDLVLKLEPCAPVDAFIPASKLDQKQDRFPIDLYLCRTCGHGQLLDVVSPKLLFGDYIYTTASSPGLVNYFQDYAGEVLAQLRLPTDSLVVDIGSNDGTLLSFFKKAGMRVLGIDPADEIARTATAAGIETLPDFFTSKTAQQVRENRGPANLITANNVFAHSDDLGDMADGVRLLLAPDGVFVFEVSYLLDMVESMVFDFIYHEHLSHHSVKPLKRFMDRHGLHLFDVQRTPSKGGSLRCFAQLKGGLRPEATSVAQLIQLEEDFGLYHLETYRSYSGRIAQAKQELQVLLGKLRVEGKSVAAYGASATGTVLTYHFELADHLRFIVDDNPVRQHRFSPGHHIPIVGPDALVKEKPDYVLILAWRFAEMIVTRHPEYLDRGGHFIIPLPELKVI